MHSQTARMEIKFHTKENVRNSWNSGKSFLEVFEYFAEVSIMFTSSMQMFEEFLIGKLLRFIGWFELNT